MNKTYFEVVEVCPYCGNENIYPMHNVNINGYVVHCKHCGEEILLCDECLNAEDNLGQHCNWNKTNCGGKCFRGTTINKFKNENMEVK